MMCFARLVLGADTAIDLRRRGKNSTLLGDDMVVVVSAAAVTGGTLSLVLNPTAAEYEIKIEHKLCRSTGRRSDPNRL